MSDRKPKPLDEVTLDTVQGGGLLDAEPGTFGLAKPYIGETEKGVWKAPAGIATGRAAEP